MRKAPCAATGQGVGCGQSGPEWTSPVTRDRERETEGEREAKTEQWGERQGEAEEGEEGGGKRAPGGAWGRHLGSSPGVCHLLAV